jgi:hypothetical protein
MCSEDEEEVRCDDDDDDDDAWNGELVMTEDCW